MDIISRIISEDDHYVYGARYALDNGIETRIANSDWVKVKGDRWFTGSPIEMMQSIGIETSAQRAANFAESFGTSLDGFYYLAAATAPGTGDEALKWMMGGLAAVLNARGLDSRAMRILPADWLRAFVRDLVSSAFDRSFAKAIFAELIDAPHFENGLPVTGDIIMHRLRSDPRFKAADGSEIDDMIDQIIADNPDQVEKARANPKLIQWFVGQVMKASKGKAPAPVVLAKLTEKLS